MAEDPANHLDFKGLSLVCDTSATQGVETELYLKIKFGLQDQARISRITGIRSNSWHISVGHFETKTSDTQAELNSILSHLNVLATDKKMIDLLKPQNPPVALKTIRIVRTDNVNAKYATYREIKSGRREHHEGRSSE